MLSTTPNAGRAESGHELQEAHREFNKTKLHKRLTMEEILFIKSFFSTGQSL